MSKVTIPAHCIRSPGGSPGMIAPPLPLKMGIMLEDGLAAWMRELDQLEGKG